MFPGTLKYALAGRALKNKLWQLDVINIRDFSTDKHGSVDDAPLGGGHGMIMRADVIDAALQATEMRQVHVFTQVQGLSLIHI